MDRRTSPRGRDAIKREEGLRLTAYKPVSAEPFWTIGYGHYGPDVQEGQKITKAEAEALLNQDIFEAEDFVNRMAMRPLSQNQFDALVSWAFNVGENKQSRGSQIWKDIEAGHFDRVPHTLRLWNKASGKRNPILVRRREREIEMWEDFEAVGELPVPQKVDPPEGRKVRALLKKDGSKIARSGASVAALSLGGALTEVQNFKALSAAVSSTLGISLPMAISLAGAGVGLYIVYRRWEDSRKGKSP